MVDAVALFLVGVLSGVLSVLAGGGATVVLPVLLVLGLSADQANATSRLNLMVGTMIATVLLVRNRKINWHEALPLIVAAMIGGLLGALLGVQVHSNAMFAVIMATSVISLVLVFLRPNRWLSSTDTPPRVSPFVGAFVYGLLCAYGGVIAADSAILRLIVLVLVMGIPLNKANPIKVITGLALYALTAALYGNAGLVNWPVAAWLAAGTAVGAGAVSAFAASDSAKKEVYLLLQVTVTLETALLFAQWLGWIPHL